MAINCIADEKTPILGKETPKPVNRKYQYVAAGLVTLAICAVAVVLLTGSSKSSSQDGSSASLFQSRGGYVVMSHERSGRSSHLPGQDFSVRLQSSLDENDTLLMRVNSGDTVYLANSESMMGKQQLTDLAARSNDEIRCSQVQDTEYYTIAMCDSCSADTVMRTLGTDLSECEVRLLAQQSSSQASLRAAEQPSQLRETSDKDDFVNSLSSEVYMDFLNELTGETSFELSNPSGSEVTRDLSTRYAFSTERVPAGRLIAQQLTDAGVDEVVMQSFNIVGGVKTVNVIGVVEGSVYPDEVVVVGAHYDSRATTSDESMDLAPGAVDNGSGVAAVIAAAKALNGRRPTRTIHFVAFAAEEQGLLGSIYYVSQADLNDVQITASLVMDMIGYSSAYYGVTIEGTEDPAVMALMDLTRANVEQYAPTLDVYMHYDSYGSDHVPFQEAGYACVLAIEMDDVNYPYYHTSQDTVDNINIDQSMDITRAVAGTLYDCAFSF